MKKIKVLTQKILPLFFFVFSLMVFSSDAILAHPGNTASDGCHYCRTNCDSWGVAWNARHCHGGSATKTTQSKTQSDNINWVYWIIGIGTAGVIGYNIKKNKK